MDRSVYSNVTVIVVVVVLVCVLCNVSPMISHLFWSLEDLLPDRKSQQIASTYRKLVKRNHAVFFFCVYADVFVLDCSICNFHSFIHTFFLSCLLN